MRTNEEIDAFLDGKTDEAVDEIDAYLDGKIGTAGQEGPGYLETAGRSFAQGAVGIAGGAGSAVKWLGDVSAGPVVAGAGEKISQSMGELSQELAPKGPEFEGTFVENPSVKRAWGLMWTAAPSLGLAMGTGMAAAPLLGPTGGAVAAAGVLGATEGAPYYEEARQAGKSIGEASKIGAATTLGTTVLEFLPISRFLKGIKGGVIVRGLKGGAMESTQEMSQQLWQNLVKKYGYDKTQDLAEGIVESGIAAFGTGAPVGVIFKEVDPVDVQKAKDDIDKQIVALADKIDKSATIDDKSVDDFLDGKTDKDPRQVALEKAWARHEEEIKASEPKPDLVAEAAQKRQAVIDAEFNVEPTTGEREWQKETVTEPEPAATVSPAAEATKPEPVSAESQKARGEVEAPTVETTEGVRTQDEVVSEVAPETPETVAEDYNKKNPGHSLKYDGEQDRSPLNKPPMYQFTAYDGPAKGATFNVEEPTIEAVGKKLDSMVAMRKKKAVDRPKAKAAPEKEASVKTDSVYDPEAFNKKYTDAIKKSKSDGNKHLDSLSSSVETMRGQRVKHVVTGEVGVITSVTNRGNVYAKWESFPGDPSYVGTDSLLTDPLDHYAIIDRPGVKLVRKKGQEPYYKILKTIDRRKTPRSTNGVISGKGDNGKTAKPAPVGKNVKDIIDDGSEIPVIVTNKAVKKPTIEQVHQAVVRNSKQLPKIVEQYGKTLKKDYKAYLEEQYGKKNPVVKSSLDKIEGKTDISRKSSISSILGNDVGSARVINDISEHAITAFDSGAKRFKDFSRSMKERFSDIWEKLKKYIKKIFSVLNNNRGEVVIRQEGKSKSPKEIIQKSTTKSDISVTKTKQNTSILGFEYTNPFSQTDKAKEIFTRKLNDAMYWIVDKNRPIQTVQDKLAQVTDKINVFLKETQRPKITAARIEKFWEDEVGPLIEKMSKYGVEVGDLELYSHAKHVIGDNLNVQLRERNAKMQVEEIIGILDKKEAKAVEESVQGVKNPSDWLNHLEEIFDTYSENEDVKMIKARWDKFAEKPSGMTDKEAKEVLKQYEGDKKIEELRKMMLNINEGRIDLLFNAGQIPKEEYDRIVNKYKYYVPLQREGFDDSMFGTTKGLKPSGRQVKVRSGSTRKVVNILGNTVANYEKAINIAEKATSQRALYGLAKANLGSDTIKILPVKKSPRMDKAGNIRMYPNLFEVEPNEMRIMVDGKQYLIEVNKDDKDAMLMMRTLKAEDGMNGPIVNFLAKINRILARINTTWSPEFIVSNFIRDIQTAGINIKDTGVKGEKMFAGAKNAIKAIWAVERGKRKGTDLEKMYDRFKAAGGKIGWADVHGSVENLSKKLTAELEMQSGKRPTRKAIKGWLDLIENANTSIENGIRLHAFKLAVEQGKTDERAAQIASDLTVDFTKKGAAGPVINSLYLFANAGIQGSYRILRAAIKSREVQKMLAGIVGASFVVGLANSMAGEDEDGEDYFNKIDDFVRERNMIFMIPRTDGKYAKIPAPWGYNLFWNIGSELSRAVTKENFSALSSAGRLFDVAIGAFNPIQSGTLLQTLSPTVADPFVMVSENKNWFGGDLMPMVNKFEKVPTPDSQRYWKSASSGSKFIAKTLNRITGGDKIKSGGIDVSPETLDLIMDTAGGSALRFFKDSFGVPMSKIRGEEVQMHKIPFARRVVGEQPEWANSRIYYENIENVLIVKARLKAYRGTDQYPSVARATISERKLMPLAESSEKRLRKLRKSLKAAEVSGNKDRIEAIKKSMNAVYNRFNKFYNKEK